MIDITEQQQQIYDYMLFFLCSKNRVPTISEIVAAFSSSNNEMNAQLNELKKARMISFKKPWFFSKKREIVIESMLT